MHNLLMAAAATIVIATPAFAETTGSLGIRGTNNEYDSGFDYDVWELEGAIFHRIAGPWAVQADGRYEDVDYSNGFDDEGNHLALHGLYASDAWTAGVFVGQAELFGGFEFDFYGAEGAYRFSNLTLVASTVQGELTSFEYDRYRVGAKYFFGDNVALGGNVALTEIGNFDWTTLDVNAEYRFGSFPITLTGGYLRLDGDFIELDALTLGARWDFGSASLREADRTAPIADLRNYVGDLRRLD